jgi:meckelin
LIDWEKPSIEENDTMLNPNTEDEENKEISIKKARVVAWRSIFVANEFNELQSSTRYISPETTLIWLCFFLRAVEWEKWAASDPDATKNPSDLTPQNYILLFFIVSTLFLAIGAAQYIIKGIQKVKFPMEYTSFVDLCAVSNISVLIMDQEFHGYYIHGQAPWS